MTKYSPKKLEWLKNENTRLYDNRCFEKYFNKF